MVYEPAPAIVALHCPFEIAGFAVNGDGRPGAILVIVPPAAVVTDHVIVSPIDAPKVSGQSISPLALIETETGMFGMFLIFKG